MELLHDFPELRTARLLMRAMEVGDATGYAELLSDDSAYPYITESGPIGVSEVPGRINRNRKSFREGSAVYWALDCDGTFIGYVALHGPSESVPALSYAIRSEWRRQGFATEAVDAVCVHAFEALGCDEIVARSHLENEASAGLLLGLGFRDVGVVSVTNGQRKEFRRAAS